MPMTREEFLKRFQENASHLGNPETYSRLIADYVDSKLPPKLNDLEACEKCQKEIANLKSENQRLATENGTMKIKLQAISRALAAN